MNSAYLDHLRRRALTNPKGKRFQPQLDLGSLVTTAAVDTGSPYHWPFSSPKQILSVKGYVGNSSYTNNIPGPLRVLTPTPNPPPLSLLVSTQQFWPTLIIFAQSMSARE